MPGNRTVFNDAITKGHNAAWDGQWTKAAAEYRRALVEFPDDVSIRLSLAHALEELGQWESALREYQHLAQAQPHDPVPLDRVAALLEKLRRVPEAAGAYVQVADLYAATKLTSKAIEAWHKAADLEPDRTDIHQKLVEVFTRTGQHPAAALEQLALAWIYRKRGDRAKAVSVAEQAVALDPNNAAVRAFIDEMTQSDLPAAVSVPSPVDEAEKNALSRLAETLLEAREPNRESGEDRQTTTRQGISQAEVDALIARAVDAQMRHRVADAIEAYRKLMAQGVARPEVKFNLGLLYFETMRYDEAIQLLSETVGDEHFALASHYALGQCFRAHGKMDRAVEHFLEVVKIVDLSNVRRDQADDLIRVYEELAESFAAQGDRAQVERFSQLLEEFLSSKGWEDKVQQVRQRLEAIKEEGEQVSLVEAIEVRESDRVLEALALSHEYLRREKLGAASEECLLAIELAPNYLPAHIRLAEIMVKQDRLLEANAKYQTLAELCSIVGDLKRAETMYRSVLKIASDDVGARSKLIDLLAQQNRAEEALEQYLDLGDSFARANQVGKALEKFTEGVRLATRTGQTGKAALTLRHRLAEMRARQNDFAGALTAYQEIRQQSPDDERAQFYIVDLEFRLNQTGAALRDLEELLTRYQTRNEPQKATAVLEALAQSYPAESDLVTRLAQHYRASGATDQAIATLDALGEAQLGLGNKRAAATTIRQIIELHPPRVEDYQKLLQEISR
ncbi:MAG: tetratricopeptide repeat protein [Anaerolineales bacterium]|nr:tetratricopeptide repeat protein [Anaerolineales bacterium]